MNYSNDNDPPKPKPHAGITAKELTIDRFTIGVFAGLILILAILLIALG